MLVHIRPALVMLAAFTLLTGIVYPLSITGIAQVVMRTPANGSLAVRDGKVIGSSLIGQPFTSERYFHGRPSATSAPDPADATKTIDTPYNAVNSGGSNLGPTSKKLIARVQGDVDALRRGGAAAIPADAVTTSASGLDPDISPDFAELQVARVAVARKVPEERVRAVVGAHIRKPALGLFGEPRVNVLELNLALDAALGVGAG